MAYGPSRSRSKSLRETRSPNLIPIMNLFIVIIPMLMTIMISVRLAMIEITLPAQGAAQQEEAVEEPPRALTLVLYPDRFEIKVEDRQGVTTIPMLSENVYDYVSLDEKIAGLKKEFPKQLIMEILPDPNVKFDTLLRSIDICKSHDFPSIKYLTTQTKFYKAK
ncbi:MAG: biopolymer transporter ExbD [Candidatus Cloacimonetes bacterium]|nr:biopolymer transporter ExbD [Candidatus Cloacimonadota bacterium]MCF7814443.1 biopolymer transporter ExbD [Candidatus Cloacimonadota bacterium]MCF7868793.1 biopolymer transporter ExbD [Candidatus Cloacimonadota bacterium]